jgi:hypothetical protein
MVTFFSFVLFLHVVAALSIFAVLAVDVVVLNRLRQASTFQDALPWVDVSSGSLAFLIGSPPVLFASGGYMAHELAAWNFAWPKVAVVSLAFVAVLGAIAGRRMRAIRQSFSAGDLSGSEMLRRFRDPFLHISLSVRVALVLGIAYLMTATPDLLTSVLVIVVSATFGLGWALLARKASPSPSTLARGSRSSA